MIFRPERYRSEERQKIDLFLDSPWFCLKFKLFLISVFEEIMFEEIFSWYSG